MIYIASILQIILIIFPNINIVRESQRKDINPDETIYESFKRNFIKSLSQIKWVLLMLAVGLVLGQITSYIGDLMGIDSMINQNELAVDDFTKAYPMLMLVYGAYIGPCAEEIQYRYLIKNYIKNEKAGILIATLLFAISHLGTLADVKELLAFPAYFMLGLILMRVYRKEGLATSIGVHRTYNFVLLLATIMVNTAN